MADIISKILLQAQGGDQVAREIGKIKKSADDAKAATQGLQSSGGGPASPQGGIVNQGVAAAERQLSSSLKNLQQAFDGLADTIKKAKAGGSGSDPFDRAVGQRTAPVPAGTPYVPGAAPPAGIPGAPSVPGAPVPPTRTGTASANTFTRNAASLFSSVGQFGAGDAVGAIGSGVQAATGMLGVGASAALLGVAGAMAVNKLAEGDLARREQLVFSGMTQRLGKTNYKSLSDPIISMGNLGYQSTSIPLLQALSTSGATSSVFDIPQGKTKTPFQEMLEMQYNTGIDSGAIGKMYGALRSGGGGGGTVYMGGDTARAAVSAFGTSRATEFVSTVTSGIQSALSSGMEKSAAMFGEKAYDIFVKPLRDLATAGNLAPEAASSIYRRVQDATMGTGRGIQSPEDVMQFMMFRKEGESYFDTLRRMATPESETERYKNLQMQSGGNKDILTNMIMQTYGLNIHEADAYQRSLDRRVKIGEAQAKGIIDVSTGKVIQPDTLMDDDTLKRAAAAYATEEAAVDLKNAAGGVKAAVVEWFQSGFGPKLSPEARAMQNQLEGIDKSKSSLYSKIREDVGDQIPSAAFLNVFNPDVATFAQTAYSGMSAGQFGPQEMRTMITKGSPRNRATALANNPITGENSLLSELGAYGMWKSGAEVSPAEETYFKAHTEKFDLAQKMISENSGYLRTEGGMTELLNALRDINSSKQFDKETDFISIAEALYALIKVLETDDAKNFTPSNGTE